MRIETDEYIVNIKDNKEMKEKVFAHVLEFFKTHGWHSDCIYQNDGPQIDGPELFVTLLEVINPEVKYKDEE